MVKLTKLQEENIKNLCSSYNIDYQLVDYNSFWDNNISEKENLELIKPIIEELASSQDSMKKIEADKKVKRTSIKAEREKIEAIELEQFKKEEERAKQELNKSVESMLKNSNAEVDKYFSFLKSYVKFVADMKSDLYSLVVVSDGGFGKTANVLMALKEVNSNYEYVSSYSTTVELVNFLYTHKSNKVIVLDDIENIFHNSVALQILKSALWNVGNKRIVSYLTTSKKLESPSQFEFSSKIIFLLNKIPENNPVLNALLSRSLLYNLTFSYSELIQLLGEIAKLPYKNLTLDERKEIYTFIQENSDESCEDLNIRTLIKAFELYIQDKKGWKKLVKPLLAKNEKLYLLKKFIEESLTVREAQERWCEMTGMCRKSFFNYRNKLYPNKFV